MQKHSNCTGHLLCFTYGDNNEIQPTPRIREIFLKSKRQPFQKHFQHKNDRIKSIQIRHHHFEGFPAVIIDIFDRQSEATCDNHGDNKGFEVFMFDEFEGVTSHGPESLPSCGS